MSQFVQPVLQGCETGHHRLFLLQPLSVCRMSLKMFDCAVLVPLPICCPFPPYLSPSPYLSDKQDIVILSTAESGGVRPFGVSLLLAGFDDNGPQLYQIDPSGSYFAWKASAIGKNMTNAKTFLEKRYSDEMALEDAIHTALLTLKEGFEGQVSGSNIEVSWGQGGWRV